MVIILFSLKLEKNLDCFKEPTRRPLSVFSDWSMHLFDAWRDLNLVLLVVHPPLYFDMQTNVAAFGAWMFQT